MIAAIGVGEGVLPPPAPFDAVIMMAVLLIHFRLPAALAFVLAFIVRAMSVSTSTLTGAAFGLGGYGVAFLPG